MKPHIFCLAAVALMAQVAVAPAQERRSVASEKIQDRHPIGSPIGTTAITPAAPVMEPDTARTEAQTDGSRFQQPPALTRRRDLN